MRTIVGGSICVGMMNLFIDSYAEEQGESLRTQKGLRFTVPEDWPIEKRGGGLAPIPVEEYVLKRFKEIIAYFGSFVCYVLDSTVLFFNYANLC